MSITTASPAPGAIAASLTSGTICVGVDDESSGAACEWAACEAASCDSPLAVVNSWEWKGHMQWPGSVHTTTEIELSRESIAIAQRHAERIAAAIEHDIQSLSLMGPPVETLVAASHVARLLVLGARSTGMLSRMVLGSTSHAVVTRASCPVVVVPAQSPPERAPAVVVGIAGDEFDDSVMRFAFDYAQRRGRRVGVIHCWKAPTIGSNRSRPPMAASEWLDGYVSTWRRRFPGVPVYAEVVAAHAVDGLVEAASGRDLLVLGKTRPRTRFPAQLGSVCLAALHHVQTPVAIIPPGWSPMTAT